MRGMANRKGQQQPMRKGTARQPGLALSAALAGRPALGVASAMDTVDRQRTLAAETSARARERQTQAIARAKNSQSLADAIGVGVGVAPKPKPKPRPANHSSTREGSTGPPANREYTTKGQLNQEKGSAREGLAFDTYTRADRPGIVYHEYTINGKKKAFGVRANKNSLGASTRQKM
jgi:hypothetical protein